MKAQSYKFTRAKCLVLAMAAGALAESARGQTVEDLMMMPTDQAALHLFPLNPTTHKSEALQGGAVLGRETKEIELDQGDGGDLLKSSVHDDYIGVGSVVDLGAGAGLGIGHQIRYRNVESTTSQAPDFTRTESIRMNHSAVKLIVELTSQVYAGMSIRYLFYDYGILGNYFVDDSDRVVYKTTMVGYGSGFAYRGDRGGLAYAYYPPLRGKAEVLGEEKIVVDPGQIALEAYYDVNDKVRAGLLAKKHLNEFDDRASGTTVNDANQSQISLYGLDLDQYLLPEQLIMLGGDYRVSPTFAVRAAIGQQRDRFNFRDLQTLNGMDQRQGEDEDGPEVKYNKIRIGLHLDNDQVNFYAGTGIYSRSVSIGDQFGGGDYSSSGRELYVTVGAKL